MKVQVVKAGTYADFRHIKMGGREYEAGETVTWPDWYAQKLLVGGFVIEMPAIMVMTEPIVMLREIGASASADAPVKYMDVHGTGEAPMEDEGWGSAVETPAITVMAEELVVVSSAPPDAFADVPQAYPDVTPIEDEDWGSATEIPAVDIPISVSYLGDEEPAISNDESVGEFKEINVTGQAKALAAELGVDLFTVEGTGRGGRVTIKDVRAAESN